jgi:hypothetical protein
MKWQPIETFNFNALADELSDDMSQKVLVAHPGGVDTARYWPVKKAWLCRGVILEPTHFRPLTDLLEELQAIAKPTVNAPQNPDAHGKSV